MGITPWLWPSWPIYRRPLPLTVPVLVTPGRIRRQGPILDRTSSFQWRGIPLDPAELYFRAGAPIGGPYSAFRGLAARREPSPIDIGTISAPIDQWAIGPPGSPIGMGS